MLFTMTISTFFYLFLAKHTVTVFYSWADYFNAEFYKFIDPFSIIRTLRIFVLFSSCGVKFTVTGLVLLLLFGLNIPSHKFAIEVSTISSAIFKSPAENFINFLSTKLRIQLFCIVGFFPVFYKLPISQLKV